MTLLKYDSSFKDMCVPYGEGTEQISGALVVAEMFSLYLIQGYESFSWLVYLFLSRDVRYCYDFSHPVTDYD